MLNAFVVSDLFLQQEYCVRLLKFPREGIGGSLSVACFKQAALNKKRQCAEIARVGCKNSDIVIEIINSKK